MSIILEEASEFNPLIVSEAIQSKKCLTITSHSLPQPTQNLMSNLLSELLNQTGYSSYFVKLNYCLSEISSNALKANMKRVYFEEKNLDIANSEDYKNGMENFKNDIYFHKKHFFEVLDNSSLYIKFLLEYTDEKIILQIRNNSIMTVEELQRIKERFENVNKVSNEEFYSEFIDESEGAGLGIRSILLALISFGLDTDHFQLYVDNNETVSKIIIEKTELPELDTPEELEDLGEIEELGEIEDLEEI